MGVSFSVQRCVNSVHSLIAVKMSHLLSAACQDGASLGRWGYVWVCPLAYRCVYGISGVHSLIAVKMSHLLSAACQDGASLGRWGYVWVCPLAYRGVLIVCIALLLSRCLIFCQQPAKMAHL